MTDDATEELVEKPPKAPILPAIVAAILVAAFYAGGYFTMASPMDVAVSMPGEEEMIEEEDTGPVARRYVSFPLSISVDVPRWGTLLVDIGMAVNADLPMSVTDAFLTDTAPLAAPLTQAMADVVEHPDATDLEAMQRLLPPLMQDGLNGVMGTEDLPTPVLEIYILKLITTKGG